MEKLLKIEDLHVDYSVNEGVVRAVNGLSLQIGTAETVGLVGETGAGKTTTALSIMGLLPKQKATIRKGTIKYKCNNLLGVSEKQMQRIRGADISMIFQDPMTSLNPVMTIENQIKEVIEQHDKGTDRDINEKVDEILNMVGIMPSRKKSYPHEFSGGMKQRVVIAMALACRPTLLIADEPTTALDVTIQAQVLNLIDELKNKLNTSMLLITHDLGVVYETCDRVAIMYAGEIIEQGTIDEVFDNNRRHHPYTEGLFGSIPDLTIEEKRLNPVLGEKPDPKCLPSGCKFHPRCKLATTECTTKKPTVYQQGTFEVKCNLFDLSNKLEEK